MQSAMRLILSVLGGLLCWAPAALACPFCSAVSQTLSEEMEAMPVVCIVRLVGAPAEAPKEITPPNQQLPRTRFKIEKVLKGSEYVKVDQEFEAIYFGVGGEDKRFLVNGSDPPDVMWSTPLILSPRAVDYVLKLPSLPKEGERLEFFQEYLEDEDPMLAADAYDEFAKSPYAAVVALKDKMHHDRLQKWLSDPEMPATRKRLYYTMFGVCAQPGDDQFLEKILRSDDRKLRAGLDALIACYLLITKEKGLPLIDELFLKNTQAEYADTYAAIMALRFHGTEVEVLPKSEMLKSMRLMLDRPELADLVIPDLARWEDWEIMPRLVQLFKEADEQSSWVRVPVINYLRACPLPEAAAQLEELAKIDPDAVKRASTFFPIGGLPALNDSPSSQEAAPVESPAETPSTETPAAGTPSASTPAAGASSAGSGATDTGAIGTGAADIPAAESSSSGPPTSGASATGASTAPTDPAAGNAAAEGSAAEKAAAGASGGPGTAELTSGAQPAVAEANQERQAALDPFGDGGVSAIVEPAQPLSMNQRLRQSVFPLVLTLALAVTMRTLLGGNPLK